MSRFPDGYLIKIATRGRRRKKKMYVVPHMRAAVAR
jgi:hypothetical protein